MRTTSPFFTVNYLMDDFFLNVCTPNSKFVRVVSQLLKCFYNKVNIVLKIILQKY